MAPWKLPLVVGAIALPIVVAFYFGGAGVGVAMGALVTVTIIVLAVRDRPRGAIGSPPAAVERRRLLVVLGRPAEDRRTIEAIAAVAREEPGPAQTLLLSPARIGFLERWTSDVEEARQEAQQQLVLAVASLAKVGIVAEGRVGDEDLVQAVEDQLGSFLASDVVLVTGDPEEDPDGAAAAAELRSRLRARFLQLEVRGPAAG